MVTGGGESFKCSRHAFQGGHRAVRDRYNLLSMNLRRKVKTEVKESGIEVEMTDTEKALNID